MINKNVYYRFKPEIDNGTLILFFADDNRIFELTKPYYIS